MPQPHPAAQLTVRNGTSITTGNGNLLNVISTDPATLVSNVNFTTENITATGNIIADAASIARWQIPSRTGLG
jgi:hypothetical protein